MFKKSMNKILFIYLIWVILLRKNKMKIYSLKIYSFKIKKNIEELNVVKIKLPDTISSN